LFHVADPVGLAAEALALLGDPGRRARLVSAAAAEVGRYDWSRLGRRILDVYETVAAGAGRVRVDDTRG
jgi:phosphatidylinositol alpha-mannosyltransferase